MKRGENTEMIMPSIGDTFHRNHDTDLWVVKAIRKTGVLLGFTWVELLNISCRGKMVTEVPLGEFGYWFRPSIKFASAFEAAEPNFVDHDFWKHQKVFQDLVERFYAVWDGYERPEEEGLTQMMIDEARDMLHKLLAELRVAKQKGLSEQ